MPALAQIVRSTLARYKMAAPGQKILVAVSGGPDSTAMLHILAELAPELRINLAVAHLDHGFRPESASEARFVAEMAKALSLPCAVEKADLLHITGNRQSAARDARYAFLQRVAEVFSADKVAVGHTADDQAETYLMREIRGSGVRGLSAIPPVRDNIIRPLIEAGRDDVIKYLEAKGIGSVTDPSNLKPVYLRNAIRLELMPLLKRYNPAMIETLSRSADILRAEDEFLSGYAANLMPGLVASKSEGRVTLYLGAFTGLHEAMKRRVLRLALALVKGDLLAVSYTHVADAVSSVASGKTGRGYDMPGGVRVEKSYDRLIIYRPVAAGEFSAILPVPAHIEVPAVGIAVESRVLTAGEAAPVADSRNALFDLDRLKMPLTVRGRRAGDFFHPLGMSGKKKLQDYFTDIKLPRDARARAPILDTGGDVAWVMGHRQDRRFAADQGSKRVLLVEFKTVL